MTTRLKKAQSRLEDYKDAHYEYFHQICVRDAYDEYIEECIEQEDSPEFMFSDLEDALENEKEIEKACKHCGGRGCNSCYGLNN